MKTLIDHARLLDPHSGIDTLGSVALADGRIVSIKTQAPSPLASPHPPDFQADIYVDAQGAILCPGLVDAGVHLPSASQLDSELYAAVAGGVTHMVCGPDSNPILDEPGLIERLRYRALHLGRAKLSTLGALTHQLQGETLSEMVALTQAGCIGMSQAQQAIVNTQVLERALQYAANHGIRVWLSALDPWLGNGVACAGSIAHNQGLTTIPTSAETIALFTIFSLVRTTGAAVHLCRISSAEGLRLLQQAKDEGLAVTADISIQQLHLCEDDILPYDSRFRLHPPLRSNSDRAALRKALATGLVDVLVSDHYPIRAEEKILPFAQSSPGASAIELLLPLCIAWAQEDNIPYAQALSKVTTKPSQLFNLVATQTGKQLAVGAQADLCLFADGESGQWRLRSGGLHSQGQFSPFDADLYAPALPAKVLRTWVDGLVVFTHSSLER